MGKEKVQEKYPALFNFLTLVLLHATFWKCSSYPRHLLDYISIGGRLTSDEILAFLVNFLYHTIYFFCLIVFFTRGKSVFSSEIVKKGGPWYKRFPFGRLLGLLALQMVFDCVAGYWGDYLPLISRDVCTVLWWIIVYWILVGRSRSLLKQKTLLFTVVGIFAVLLGIKAGISAEILDVCKAAELKWELDSPYLRQFGLNAVFMQSILDLLFDTLLGGVLLYAHGRCLPNSTDKADEYKNSASYTRARERAITVIRFLTLCFVAVAMCLGKLLICPDDYLRIVEVGAGSHTRYTMDGSFYEGNDQQWTAYRMDGRYSKLKVLDVVFVDLHRNQKKVASLHGWGYDPLFQTYPPAFPGDITEHTVGNTTVYVYYSASVSFMEDGKPRTVRFRDLHRCEENPVLIGVFEWMISEGNVIAFEYGCDYLYRYDREFIEPYIRRYAEEEFTPAEKEMMEKAYYRSDYIAGIAERFYRR